MAQDAELKLKVSLDLAFFRQQLSTIGAQLGGQALQLNVQFDKKSIADQYRLLDRYLGRKTFKTKIESPTLDALVTKVEKLKENLGRLASEKIALDVEVASNIDDVRKSIKDKLTSVGIKTELAEPVNVDDFIRDVAKKVDDQVKKSYTAGGVPIVTKLTLPGLTDPLKALQKNLNQKEPLRAKLGTVASIKKTDVTALQAAVNEKFKDITVKVRAELDTAAAATQGPSAGSSRTFLQELKDLDKTVLQSVYRAAGEDGALAFNEGIINNKALMIQALRDAAKDASDGFVTALGNKKSALFKAAGEYAGALLGGLKKELKIQSPSREMFDIGDDAGKGFELGLLKAMELAEKSATNQMRRMLDRLARMALMMGGMSAAAINRQVAQSRALPSVNFPATVPSRPVSIGPSSTGRALSAGAGPAGMIGAAQAPAGLLPSITARSSIKSGVEALFAAGGPQFPMAPSGKLALSTEALQARVDKILTDYFKIAEVTVKEIFNPQDLKRALNIFSYLPQALRDAESRTRQARIGITSAQGIAGLLPAAAGRAPSTYSTGAIGGESREQMMARRTAEAYARSALRGMDVMGGGAGRPPSPYSYAYRSARPTSAIIPYAQPGAIVPSPVAGEGGAVPPVGGGGGTRGMGGMGGFGRALGGVNLPGAGAIRELGKEFAFATQQVLLFGQAYKMLAFIQNFPAQVGEAVSQLQNFRNTLDAISPTAEEAASSNRLILDLVEKYNVPLQSARDGFTKLYASMAPAGFSGDQVRDLFTGITQAAATFGMSADKVDRVNYAFAQMASKGQVMSEELKGQLGDVLPGAMAIFAEAAGFKGPKAIQDFSAALEDGAYKGQAMVALLNNVGIVMKQEFGPGAEGAARTFQGVINRMQNSMTLLYESFEPVAVGFLNAVVVPLTSGIKQISDGFNAFFTGTTATTAGGGVFAQQLQSMLPAIEGIKNNITGLVPVFQQFGAIAGQVAQLLLQIAGNPVVGYFAKLYLVALPLNIAFNGLIGVIRSVIGSMTALNVGLLAGSQRFTTYRILMEATGVSAAKLTGILRGVAPALNLITVGLRAIAGPVILVGISLLIERFMMLKGAIDGVGQSTKQMLAGISSMANAGAVGALKNTADDLQKQIQTFEKLRPFVSGGALGPAKQLTPGAAKTMEELGMGSFVSKTIFGKPQINDFVNASKIIEARLQGLRKAAAGVQEKLPLARRVAASIEAQTKPVQTIAPIPPSEKDSKDKKGKELDQYIQDATNALALEKERQLVAIEDKMLKDQISEIEAKRQSLLIEKLYEEKAVTEGLRVAQIKLAEDNLSAADKQLKLADLRAEKEQKIANIGAKYGVEVLKIELGLQQPIKDAISSVNEQLDEQAMIRENLKDGLTDLTYDQKAYLDVQRLTKDYGDAEKESVRERINEYQRLREEYYKNEEALKKQQALIEAETGLGVIGGGLRAGFAGSAAGVFERAMEQYGDTDYATQLANIETSAMQLRSVFEGLQSAIAGVSGAFANMLTEGITSMITGTATAKEVFASFLQSVGQALSQAASQMIATYIAIGIAKMFAGLGGGGNPEGSGGGVSDVLPGARKYFADGGIAKGGFQAFANGGIVSGGFQAFANGGVVSGPTLGLVGEGKYNEAVVPLPDGRSIPVQLGGRSARDLMGNGAPGMPQAPSLSMKFETTKINGVEYVSREQLEQAMMETRKKAARDGAAQGSQLALSKIRNSPSTRRQIGV